MDETTYGDYLVAHARKCTTPKEADLTDDFRASLIRGAIQLGKEEITDDIEHGVVPATVGSFSELHDYVDANLYGGLCDAVGDGFEWADDIDACNEVQNALDSWIKNGKKD